ncbi:MAG: alpha/beta fold hydrolase [Hyphomicrobiales bacterium]
MGTTLAPGLDVASPPTDTPRPKLLLLHGFFSSRAAWAGVRRELGSEVDAIAPSLPGYGHTHLRNDYTLDHVVDYLADLVEQEQPTHLVGHSMGGLVALALAARLPGRFERVGVLALPVFRNRDEGLAYIHRRSWFYRLFLGRYSLAHAGCVAVRSTRLLWAPIYPFLPFRQPLPLAAGQFDHCRVAHAAGLERIVFAGLADGLASRVRVPVALLHGDRDSSAPPAAARELAERHGWPFELVSGHGHQALIYHPAAVAKWVRRNLLAQ